MAVFSVNQARQFYVNTGALTENQNTAGTGEFREKNGNIYYVGYNVDGEAQRSDIIKKCNVDWVRISTPAAPKAKTYTITVNSGILDSNSKVPAGYEFILKVIFTQFIGMSEADKLFKIASVYTTAPMTVADFITAMKTSLEKNISKENKVWPILSVSSTSTTLTITEVAQEWSRGKLSGEVMPFTVQPESVTINGVAQNWATLDSKGAVPFTEAAATDGFGNTLTNGRKTADLEHFCMGERGDIYRGAGWPNNIDTRYMVDPTQSYSYLDIQYHYKGDNEDIQHSAKTLTIVGTAANITTLKTKLATLLPDGVDIEDKR